MAQVDYFLKIDGVDGEALDQAHKGEIDLESYSWGVTNAGTAGHGGGSGAGKGIPQDFHFVKRIDKSSPVLMVGCATGKHFKSAILTARKAGDKPQEFFKVTMSDCMITSYQTGGSEGSNIIPMEQLSLNFAKLEMSYKEQKKDGSLGGEVKQVYDFSTNIKG